MPESRKLNKDLKVNHIHSWMDIDDFSIWMFRDIPFTYETERHFIMLDNKIIANCKYVHQLQNLYFALTGEELKKIN